MKISFTVWAWIDDDIAYRWTVDSDWVINWEKSLWDEEWAFNELIDKSFWYITEKKKYEIAREIYNRYMEVSFLWWLNNKLNNK